MIARVALADLGYAIDKLYDYSVPEALSAEAEAGKRVSVPFARGNRRQEGMVMELTERSELSRLKSIDAWLDEKPLLTPKQLELARWMKKRFFCLRALREASLPVQPNSKPEILARRTFLTAFGLALIASTGVFLMTRMPVP